MPTLSPPAMRVTITALMADGTAYGRDSFGKEHLLRVDLRPKGSAPPAVDEVWMADRSLGPWRPVAQVGAPPAPVVTGSHVDAVTTSILTALVAQGLVKDGTPGQITMPAVDRVPPPAPTSPSASSGLYAAEGYVRAVVTVVWGRPPDYPDHSHYVVSHVNTAVGPEWSPEVISTEPRLVLRGITPGGSVTARVRAVDLSGNSSPWAEADPITITADKAAPPTPTDPIVEKYLGALRVGWDGRPLVEKVMPADFSHVEVHASKVSGYAATAATYQTLLAGAGFVVVPALDYDADYYVRLVAVDREGNRSPASGQVHGVPQRVNGDDVGASTRGDNLLLNPGFEDGATGWSLINLGGGLPVVETGAGYRARSGLARLALPCAAGAAGCYAETQPTTVEPSTTYSWLAPVGGTGTLSASLWTSPDKTTWTEHPGAAGQPLAMAADYEVETSQVLVPPGHVWAKLRVRNSGQAAAATRMYLDDTAVTKVGFSATEVTSAGVRLFDRAGDESGFFGSPGNGANSLSFESNDVTTASISGGTGRGSFQVVDALNDLFLRGESLAALLDDRARGVQQMLSRPAPGVTTNADIVAPSKAEYGTYELSFQAEAGRLYRISCRSHVRSTAANERFQYRVRDGGAGAPTTASPEIGASAVDHSQPAGDDAFINVLFYREMSPGLHRMLWTMFTTVGVPTMRGYPASPSQFVVEDVGPVVPLSGFVNPGTSTTTSASQTYTRTYSAIWSGSYTGSNAYNSDYGSECVQGYYSTLYGNQRALIGFPSTVQSDLTGASVSKIEVYLYASHWYGTSDNTAVIGSHDYSSRGSTWVDLQVDQDLLRSYSWPKPGGRWVNITSTHPGASWASGAIKGVSLGPGPTTSKIYYGRFDGVGYGNPPLLRATFTK